MNLIEEITNKAKADWVGTFPRNHADPRFKQWQEHWLAVGKAWRDELKEHTPYHERTLLIGLGYILNYYEDRNK